MKKILTFLLIFSMILTFAACGGGGDSDSTGTNGGTPTTDNSEITTNDPTNTDPGDEEPGYLQFGVSEGDYGDMFRNEGKWVGERTVSDQIMSVKTSSATGSSVDWVGVCAGKSFEYETKLRINSYAKSYVATILESETHLLAAYIYQDKIVITDDKNAEASVNFANDTDWHIYRFSVTDNTVKLYVDGTLLNTVAMPEKASSGLLSFASKSADGSEVSYDVNYVKVKTTDESWISPSLRMTDVTNWTYEENFDGTEVPAGWSQDNGVEGEISVIDGNLILSTSNKGEFVYKYVDEKIVKCNKYVMELRLKTQFGDTPNSRVSIFNFMGNGYRIHCQLKETALNVQNSSNGWSSGALSADDGEYHTIRYEVDVTDPSNVECRVFLDGEYSFTTDLNANNGAALLKILVCSAADGETCSTSVDYWKVAILG